MLGHKTNLNELMKEVTPSTISNHYGMKLEVKYKTRKYTNTWKINVKLFIITKIMEIPCPLSDE